MLDQIDKQRLLAQLLAILRHDLAQITASQQAAQAGATHEENRSEGDKDMRATEVSYVARGQAVRVVALTDELARTQAVVLRPFSEETPLALGALVTLEDDVERTHHHFLMPGGGGVTLRYEGPAEALDVSVISTRSPLGRALLGSREGDVVSIEVAGKSREWSILAVA